MTRNAHAARRHTAWHLAPMALALATLLVWPAAARAVNYTDFTSTAGLRLNGDAAKAADLLRLTDAGGQAGSAFTKDEVVNPEKSWKSKFRFILHDSSGLPGDGIAFVIQRDDDGPRALGDFGEGLGYGGISPSLAVEFDIYENSSRKRGVTSDPNDNHVAVTTNGKPGRQVTANPSFELYGGERWVWLRYSAPQKVLTIWVNDTDTKPADPLITFDKNLNSLLDGRAHAGFTGGTGGADADQDVIAWKLRTIR